MRVKSIKMPDIFLVIFQCSMLGSTGEMPPAIMWATTSSLPTTRKRSRYESKWPYKLPGKNTLISRFRTVKLPYDKSIYVHAISFLDKIICRPPPQTMKKMKVNLFD